MLIFKQLTAYYGTEQADWQVISLDGRHGFCLDFCVSYVLLR